MRRLILLVVLAALAYPAGAGTRVTVAQLDQALNAALAAHKPDAEIARQIASLELSERLTEASLSGSTHVWLQVLKRRRPLHCSPTGRLSWILRLPSCQVLLLPTAPPSNECSMPRATMLRKHCRVCLTSWPPGPSTGTTTAPRRSRKGLGRFAQDCIWSALRAGRSRSVTKGKGQAVKQGSAASQEQSGLSSWGEFGFLPAVILTDTVKGKVTWSHWEQMAAGPAAVFHYAVPRSASHYEIIETVPHGPRCPFSGSMRMPRPSAPRQPIVVRFGWTRQLGSFSAFH